MPPTLYLVASFRAKAGKEEDLKAVLTTLIAPTRREPGCIQYDLLQSTVHPAEFCFIERWESEYALEQHVQSEHLTSTLPKAAEFSDAPPEGKRFVMV